MKYRIKLKSLLLVLVILCMQKNCYISGEILKENPNVIHAVSLIGNVLEDCYLSASTAPFVQFLPSLQLCLQNGSLLALDKMQQSDILQLSDGIQFVDTKMGINTSFNNRSR